MRADSSHTSLTDDIADLKGFLERTSGPIVLAAHSYGVLGAVAPEEDETVADIFCHAELHSEAPHLQPDALLESISCDFKSAKPRGMKRLRHTSGNRI